MATSSAHHSVHPTGVVRTIFSFPNPVNEVAARMVAAMVVTISVAFIISGQWWLAGGPDLRVRG